MTRRTPVRCGLRFGHAGAHAYGWQGALGSCPAVRALPPGEQTPRTCLECGRQIDPTDGATPCRCPREE